MRRACKVTLKFATETKRRKIGALLEAYRAAVNFYIRSLWETPGKLDKATLGRLSDTRLSERLKSQALKQALEIVVGTKKSAKALGTKARCPVFTGSAVLDAKIVSVEVGRGSFDLVIRVACLKKGERLVIPTNRTAVLNHWQGMEGARLIQGCALSETGIVLWIELPDLGSKTEGVRPESNFKTMCGRYRNCGLVTGATAGTGFPNRRSTHRGSISRDTWKRQLRTLCFTQARKRLFGTGRISRQPLRG